MKVSRPSVAVKALLLARVSMAQSPSPSPGFISTCQSQGCGTCDKELMWGFGFPDCGVYNSAETLGEAYTSASGTGYDVWWNSAKPDDTCQFVIRTPASQDLPTCGYYLTSWSEAGCYYTAIQDTFNIQFCCGTGDCGAANPAASIAEAKAQAAAGNTSFVSLAVDNLSGGSGKRSIEGLGDFSFRRSDYAVTQRETVPERQVLEARDDCTFIPESDLTTIAGRQIKGSDTEVCNVQGGCSIAASTAVTEGFTITPTLTGTLGFLVNVLTAALSYSFTESTTYTVTTTYTQNQGTTGYLSYNPTINCWKGRFENCPVNDGQNVYTIDPSIQYDVCTPALRTDGNPDGTWSFVYDN